ncbi:protein phosphatase 1H [Macrobrachium rosenbergii]|uniref:protein phosphatase 1H n=1 Tax=Macrobrachium rosenbergii TaxID=79674 RepID=UPI0034D46A91
MLSRFKTALYNVVGSFDPGEGSLGSLAPGVTSGLPSTAGVVRTAQALQNSLRDKSARFPYTRPHFLQLSTEDEIQVSADHAIRPIICPRDISRLPWKTGYAETINAGKSKRNEDQAVVHVGLITRPMKLEGSGSQSSSASHEQNSSKSETVINGHSEETQTIKTVMLQPQSSSLSASPATELKEDYNQTSDGSTSSNSFSNGRSEEQNKSNANVEPFCISQQPLGETSPSQVYESSTSHSLSIHRSSQTSVSLTYYIFGVFDGHAGWGAAVSAANQLHHFIHEKLCDVIDILLPDPNEDKDSKQQAPLWASDREVTIESAVTGALEGAFWQMDNVIGEDRLKYELLGGCTACVALFIHGKLFVANAGDSRGVISLSGKPHPMSFDFTPETETQRIRKLGAMHPELLGGEYTHLDFMRRPLRRDIGKRVLYRDHYMSGWAYKTLTPDDVKYPLVCGEGKRSRVLGTIGVTRGFGDHDLKAQYSSIPIKPFLTPEPEVKVFDIESTDVTDGDVLILGTDGLWDITTNEKAAEIVVRSLSLFPVEEQDKYKYRYTGAAQDLVMSARGKLKERNWRTSDDKHATIDDISVFVIPLKPYKDEYLEWKLHQQTTLACNKSSSENLTKEPQLTEADVRETDVTSHSDSNSFLKEVTLIPSSQTDEIGTCRKDSPDIKPHEDYFKDEA